MRISDWSSDGCASDLLLPLRSRRCLGRLRGSSLLARGGRLGDLLRDRRGLGDRLGGLLRSLRGGRLLRGGLGRRGLRRLAGGPGVGFLLRPSRLLWGGLLRRGLLRGILLRGRLFLGGLLYLGLCGRRLLTCKLVGLGNSGSLW